MTRKFILLLLGVAAPIGAVPPPSVDSALAALDKSLAAVEKRQPVGAADVRVRIDALRDAAPSLPDDGRGDYAASLKAQATLLAAAAAEPDYRRSAEMVGDVTADLALKNKSRLMGASPTLLGQVNVVAHVFRAGREVSGLVLAANPVALAGTKDMLFRFPRLSSPTARPLPPGRYEFVLFEDGKPIWRERADVGTISLDEVTIDLSLPAQEIAH